MRQLVRFFGRMFSSAEELVKQAEKLGLFLDVDLHDSRKSLDSLSRENKDAPEPLGRGKSR